MTPDRHGEIAERAYGIWEREGRPSGKALEHWLRAEAEIEARQPQAPTETPAPPAQSEKQSAPAPTKPRRPAQRRTRRTQ